MQYIQENKKIIGVVGVVLLAIVGVAYLYVSNPFAPTETAPSRVSLQTPPQIVDFSQAQTASGTVRYLLPKSKVTPAYSSIYNNLANEAMALMLSYKDDMSPLLIQSGKAAKAKDYATLQNIGNRVKFINDAQKIRLTTLSGDLDNLALVNKNLSDAKTTQLTNDLIATGKDMVAKYTAMTILVDNIFSGKVTASTAIDAEIISGGLVPATNAFVTSAKKLSSYFTTTLLSDTRAIYLASSTATSTKK